jgi:aldose 1-epimerase
LNRIEKNDRLIELIHAHNHKAVISLDNEGGRLKSLIFDNKQIISDLKNNTYEQSFASAILFPFANRIKNGVYSFNHTTYNLTCNEIDKNNAIHGLVFNKKFELVNTKTTDKTVEAQLEYIENHPPKAYPFSFKIMLTYTLSKHRLLLKVNIKNTGSTDLPFTLGWHPYFCIKNFDKALLKFNSNQIVLTDSKMIPTKILEQKIEQPFFLKNKQLDDCFILNNNKIEFDNGSHKIYIKTSSDLKFFQIYTPPNESKIALEPMTGFSDSFNHKKGLKILKPNTSTEEIWSVEMFK